MALALVPPLAPDAPVPTREGPLARFWPQRRAPSLLDDPAWRDSIRRNPDRGACSPAPLRLLRRSGRIARDPANLLKTLAAELRPLGLHLAVPFTNCETVIKGPCEFIWCKYNLFGDEDPETGRFKVNHPGKAPWELEETCAIRVAKRPPKAREGGQTLEIIGDLLNVTPERVCQIEKATEHKLRPIVPRPPDLGSDDEPESVES